MKKILISLTAVSICLTACGKEGDFKKAINEKLSKRPVCLNDIHPDLISEYNFHKDDLAKFTDKIKGAYIISENYDKDGKFVNSLISGMHKDDAARLDVLASAGLFTKSTESLTKYTQSYSNNGGDQSNGYTTFTIYTLTDAGKSAVKEGGSSSYVSFCYATPEVDKIENYVEGDGIGGVHYADVKYSYTYTNIADWANKPEVKAAFPEIAKTLDGTQKTAKMSVAKTNNGWSTSL